MWRLAWRNLWRNRTRTLIVATAISLTYGLFLMTLGMSSEMYGQMELAAVKTAGGNILVHGEGFWDVQSHELLIDGPDRVIEEAGKIDGVKTVIPRVLVNGLISSPRAGSPVQLRGIVPEAEATLIDVSPFLNEGTFLGDGEDAPLVLGANIVRDLEAELGDRLVLTATDPEGEMVRALFHLTGIVETGTQMLDDTIAYTTIPAAQAAVGLGDRITQIGLVLESDGMRFEVRDSLQSALNGVSGLELLTWDEAMPDMKGYIEIDRRFGYIFMIIMFVIVAFGITNSFLMVVLERIRELGLVGALGLSPRRIGVMLINETALLAAVSMTVGFGIGFGLHWLLKTYGIDLADMYGGEVELSGVTLTDTVIRSTIDPLRWTIATVGVFFMVVFSSLYPAWRSTRVDPATAMRTYE